GSYVGCELRESRWVAGGCRQGADDETDALNKFTTTDIPHHGGSPVAPGGGWAGSTSGYPDDIATRRSCGRSFKTVLRGPHRRATPGREAQFLEVNWLALLRTSQRTSLPLRTAPAMKRACPSGRGRARARRPARCERWARCNPGKLQASAAGCPWCRAWRASAR